MATYMLQQYSGSLPTKTVKKGSKGENVKNVQTFLNWCIKAGLVVDGVCGSKTVSAIKKYQRRYGLSRDGIFGSKSRSMAKYLIKLQPWVAALRAQYVWSKNQKYKFNKNPTVENSKKEGTCLTFTSVSCQRLGILPRGEYFLYDPKHNRLGGDAGASYVRNHPDIYKYFYPHKTIQTLIKEGKIKPFDIVGYDDPAYHTMVFAGFNDNGDPIFFSMGHNKKWGTTYSSYANRKVDMIVRLKKVTK